MNDFVALEKNFCPVCTKEHSHNTGILIHKNLKHIDSDKCCTGYGLCEEHDTLHKDGYVALIELKNDSNTATVKMEDAVRTGNIAHIPIDVFSKVFNSEINIETTPLVFIDTTAFSMLKKMSCK